MYGETGRQTLTEAGREGLSPHVRGNPGGAAVDYRALRSIPACTGKPLCQNDPFVIIMSKTDEPTVTRPPYGESDATPAARPATLDAWEPE